MDLHIRFWDSKKKLWLQGTIVHNSLVSHLQMIHAPMSQCFGPLEKEKFQVSSDRPNVNLLFLKVLTEKGEDEELTS